MDSGADTSYQTTEDRGRKTGRTVPQQGSLCRLSSDFCRLEVGFPIRKSADQSLFAAPHGLSQRTTSFIACACQGIHRTPLRHLIALIINARPFQGRLGPREERKALPDPRLALRIGSARTASNGSADFSCAVEQTAQLERPVSHENCPSARRSSFASFRSSPAGRPDNSSLHDVNVNTGRAYETPLPNSIFFRQAMAPEGTGEWQGSRERRGPWWSQTGSNRRPPACKAGALPTELWPHLWASARSPADEVEDEQRKG